MINFRWQTHCQRLYQLPAAAQLSFRHSQDMIANQTGFFSWRFISAARKPQVLVIYNILDLFAGSRHNSIPPDLWQ